MGKLEMPFNAIEMAEEDKINLVNRLNHGDINVSLEMRDSKGELIGFQPIISLDNRYRKIKRMLIYFEYLNNKLSNCKHSKRKEILKDINELKRKLDTIYSHKCYFIADSDDIEDAIEYLGSYKKEEMLLSYQSKDSKTY